MSGPTGLFFCGPLYDRGGYGNVCRNYVRAIRAAGIPLRTRNLGHVHAEVDPAAARAVAECEGASAGERPLAIDCWSPDWLGRIRRSGVSAAVAATIFETDSLPRAWVPALEAAREVWVPTAFNERTFAAGGVSPARLRRVPYPIDAAYFHPGVERRAIPGVEGFTLLYAFEYNWRKGFDLLLRAYGAEFTSADPITLVLKLYHGGAEATRAILESARPEFDPASARAPRVVVITEPYTADQLRTLYASCDLYVSTDRANGWGMPCMEVMSMGRAAATIDWSGSTEFMNEENALLIRPSDELVPCAPELVRRNPIYEGQRWPRVEVAEVRRVLRRAFEDRPLLARIGARAAQDMRERHGFERIGAIFRERVAAIGDVPPARGEPRAWLHASLGERARSLAGRVKGKLASIARRLRG